MKLTKRFLVLFLALVMSFTLAAPAFADEPDDGNAGIMPLLQIFPDDDILSSSSYRTDEFAPNPGAGNYIQFWFANTSNNLVWVYLYRVGISTPVKMIEVPAQTNGLGVYYSATAESGTYYVRIVAQNGGLIQGRLAVAQYLNDPT